MSGKVLTVNPKEVSIGVFHAFMMGAVAPRPIAFASTQDAEGNVNLAPFSFFNAFGSNPPLLIFSPARRVRDNTIKHTLENVYQIDEVVINIVNYAMVEQMSLASCEYERGVNEFEKAGFTPIASQMVRPPRVAESPAAFECKVLQVIETGQQGGAANLILCEVVLAHFREDILGLDGKIDTTRLDAVARMGGDWYCRAHGDALFEVPKPNEKKGIGFDQLPHSVRHSNILTGNELGRLANIEQLPTAEEITQYRQIHTTLLTEEAKHIEASRLLREQCVKEAWLTLLH
ncbi:NADH-FMN oxidoreductase RutF, flavin reductase (DIM6/NTAB) family [Flexibacter flexilis DSM 6793]|uniref:NADH-FMN oxidoreductase RutF, flavin reductase (DIM6/NTAB) family n=1 Tax=Flexibacter flexilis DSM 6793 TaxID=927664 RepID=A0A1I1LNT4_9BACT|nr:flavin reductase family protein [Flexibacter flexilis]SFC74709.1 NADH-FMN oxidoreductase RutF, flavin reductase (DIM6/NTAB) family [Flexibacter flexilis DSM 6793]